MKLIKMESEDTGGGGTGDTSSYQVLAAGDSYPKKNCQFDEPQLSIPFIPLAGEYAEYVGRTSDGLISLSNYRVFLTQRETTYHVPLGIIESIECREIVFLYLLCKDTKSYKITFGSNEECAEWQRRLGKALALPARLENVFSFAFYMWTMESQPELHQALLDPDVPQSYPDRADKMFQDEICRLGFDLGGAWRISLANQEYQLCSTYPRKIVIPASINDNNLESVARFRSARRVPAVVWRHPNGAVIARCSQPEVGWLGWRSSEDEDLVKAIAEACAYDAPEDINKSGREQILAPPPQHNGDVDAITPASDIPSLCDLPEAKAQTDIKKVLIVDARSYATAVANRARGGGCECPEYYPQCEIQFMNLANIHTIRKSHHALRLLVASSPDIPNWLSLLENTRWLAHIAGLMKAAAVVVQAVSNEARPVLVHCSDGWDRTPQITALSQLLMDPYYRTIQGFQVLVEREWVEFGHKFSDRCGCGRACEDINERCPVFLQWLDCVHHLLYAYPTAFQFNQAFLVKLAQHVYSNLFGSFICNSSQERVAAEIGDRTYSVWSLLRLNRHRYINYLYQDTSQVLTSSCHMKDLRLWTSVYMPEMGDVTEDPHTSPNIVVDEEEEEPAAAAGELVKTKSCDDLLASTGHTPHLQRRSSDPNIRDSCPNMAMLNSALGAELTSEGGTAGTRAGEETHNPLQEKRTTEDHQEEETLDNIHDNHRQQNSNSRNEESDSLTLCETETSLCSDLPTLGEDSATDTEQMTFESSPITNGHLETDDTSLNQQVVHNGLPEENGVAEYVNGYVDQGEEASEHLIDSLSSRLSKHGLKEFVGGGRLLREVESEPSIEGSTDTLVAEVGIIASEDKEKISNSDKEKPNETTHLLNGKSGSESPKSLLNSSKCCPFMNGFSGSEENEICTTNNNRKVLSKKKEQIITAEYISEDKKALNNISNSGIASSCNICIQSKKLLDETSSVAADWRGQESTVTHTSVVATSSISRGAAAATVAPASRVSHYSTPAHSRTPSSCIPSTPNEDRLGNGGDSRGNNYNTTDGLHNVSDEVTKRLHHIMLQHQAELESVKRDLAATRQALCNQMLHNRCHHHHHHDHNTEDQMSLPESVGSGSGGSVGQESGVSDTSWEALEEGDARTTLWVPDHATDQCTGCNTQFWMGRRKHHCRNCGKIFCSECSDNNVPIPSEQLFHPVRVCGSCFFTLGPELSKPKILAAASN